MMDGGHWVWHRQVRPSVNRVQLLATYDFAFCSSDGHVGSMLFGGLALL